MKALRLAAVAALIFGLCAFVPLTSAQAADSPQKSVSDVVDLVLETLKDPAYADPATRQPLREKIEKTVKDHFDFSEFSARTVGAKWKNFSDDQKTRFTDVFARLLMTTYLDNISGYNGEKVEYTGEKLSAKGNRAEVSSIVTLGDGKKVPVDYRLMDKDGKWVVYDIIIENVSLIKNYRAQFKEIMVKGDAEVLIDRVRERTEALAQKKN